ncbi:hypothetical protein [Enterococcus phage vB_EfaS_EF1c55]|nr:hypothetical protein [Enterococcus phage vB_EfaS_EF1c55]DAJ06201.1 MAG TPA: hypothetical protein [Caudoviricetes sp.]
MLYLIHKIKRGGNNKMTTALTIALISLVATLAVSIHEINR